MVQRHPRLRSQSAKVQARNKALWNENRTREDADFYTIGYSGRNVREFCDILREVGVGTVVDIRHNPNSLYKPEFNKWRLEAYLTNEGIDYVHSPQLGVPWDVRGEAVGEGDRMSIWRWYDAFVVRRLAKNLHLFFNAGKHPLAFMCLEVDPTSCHRHRLSLALEATGLRSYDL